MVGGRLGETIGIREELIKKACSFSFKAHRAGKPYVLEKCRSSSEAFFSFPGSWSVEDWFSDRPFGKTEADLNLFPSLRSIGNDEVAMVNEAFSRRFKAILRTTSFANEVEKAVKERKQIVFTGHSSGGPMAILATLWFLEKFIRSIGSPITPLCVTFGSPLVGDRIIPHALRRENWDTYFIHFVMRCDIVPRLMLAPLVSTERELQPVFHFFNPESPFFEKDSIATAREASVFFTKVMRNVSSVASHTACKLMGSTNSLLETVSSFIELSPYRPFGTYIFCTGNGKLVVVQNSDAVLQLLFYSCQCKCEAEIAEVAGKCLKEHLGYENELQRSLQKQNMAYLDNHLIELPLSSDGREKGEMGKVNIALNDLGLSTRGRLCLRAAGELQKQIQRNQDKIDLNKYEIEAKLKHIRNYQTGREVRGDYYVSFKLQNDVDDIQANVRRLELVGMWDEIIEMLKRYELPDEFEGWREWIELGTEYRRLVEPLEIANYYRHLKNDDTGPYLIKGRPKRYRYTQRWLEHAEKMEKGSSSESCFWARMEELRISNKPFEDMKKHNLDLETDILKCVQHRNSKERFMSKSFLPKENMLKAVKLCTREGMKDLKKQALLEALAMDPENKSIISGVFSNSKENKDKEKASVKVYTRRVGQEVFWDEKFERHQTFKELEMDPEICRDLRDYKMCLEFEQLRMNPERCWANFRINAESCWDSMELEHPATLEELGMHPENNGIISDFLGFVRAKEFCKRIGQASRNDNCLVYDSPGTDRTSIIAAMANYLKFDIYHLDLTSFSSLRELNYTLLSTRNRSVIVIEGLYHCDGMVLNLTTDEILNKIDELLLWRCNDERIFIFASNHRDQHAAASLRPLNMDIYIHTSSPQPIALPDRGKMTYHNSLLVSNPGKENKIEAYDSTKRYSLPNFDATENKAVKVYSRQGRDWLHSMELEQPPAFAELGKDPENEGIISDLLRFVGDKELYKRLGKTWKRGYLLFDSPGTDRSSLIAAMANFLKIDIYDFDLTGLSSLGELCIALPSITNRGIIAIKDFDHWFLSNENELTLSSLFKIICELMLCCQDQQIIVLTTNHNHNHNHRHQFHTALLRPLNIDAYMHTSSPQPMALPYGGEIVQLDSLEQRPLVDFDATNNKAYQSSVPESNSEKENTRETLKRRCMTESVHSSDDSTTRISLTDFNAPVYTTNLVRAYQSSPVMFTSENKDTREGLDGECLTKSVLSDDDLAKRELLPERTSLAFSELSEDIDGFYDSISVDSDSDSDNFDSGVGMLSNLKDEFVDSLSSSCGDEQITVSTTNHRDPHDAALLPIVNMDTDIHKASPQPIALPDCGEVVQLESIEQKSLVDFDATNNRPYQSGVLVSSEKKNTIEAYEGRWESVIQRTKKDMGDALKEECLTKSALGLDDSTEQNSVDPRQGKGRLHSMEHEQPATFAELGTDPGNEGIVSDLLRFVREKEFYKSVGKAWKRGYLLYDPPCIESIDRSNLMAYMAKRLEFEIYNLDLTDLSSIEELKYVLVSIRNRSLIAIKDFDQWFRMLPNLKNESASSLDWPIGLPVGGHVVVRKTFKRECRTISVSFEGHQQHFGSRCEDVANSPCVNRICEQHGISLVPTVKRIHRQHGIHRLPFRQGNSSGRERPVEVISVSTEEKLISRLQFLRMSLLGRSSLRPLALPSGSEFPRHIAFSSSELTSTNNRAYPSRQDQCGSSASHIEKERTRETLYGEGTASNVFSFEHVQQHFGCKRKNDAKILGVCLSTFKRITRHHGIRRRPNQIRNNVWRSPDPHREKNLSPTFKTLSTNCPIAMENDMGCENLEPNELLPDSFEDLNFRNGENGSLAEIEKTPTFHDFFSGNCCEADICLSEYDKTQAAGGSFKWAFQLKGLTTQFTANPNLNTLVLPHPQIASTKVLSENMGSSEDGTKLLASQAEGFLEGDVTECSNLTFPLEGQSMQATACPNHNTLQLPQPLIALTQTLNENMGSSEDWIASQQEPFLEGHVSGSINLTVPACSGPSPSQQPMPTTPYTMHRVLHMLPPLTSSLDASSVKMKATYRDTIIEFQLPLTSGSIELKEEVAKILKLEIDSFNVRYKDEEGEGDWILIPCDKDLRNYLQLFSSLVNPVIRLLVVDKDANLTNLDPMALKQPATFVESGIDPGSNGIVSDLLRFVSEKEICKKAGKAWTRFYLLYEPPDADRSSLITDMANYLGFDICYLDLRSMSSIPELKNMLLSTPNRSLIAIQDIDHSAVMLRNLKNELTVSCLLKYVDGLFSRCGDERIIVFTTNHRDRNDAALLPLVNMDIYIPAPSPQPIALPDGGEIVQLESSEQKPLVDFDATNNRECHSGILVSSSKNNNKREASKRLCMTKSVLSVVDPTTGISLTEFDAPNNGAHLVRACQGGFIMSNSEKKDTEGGLKGDFLTKSVLSLDDSTKQKSLPDCDATENEAHLLIAYQSCPVVSLLENRNRGEALKRECITKSILGLEDLQQHSGGRRDNAAKSFAAIYDPGIHTTNSLARKSFEVVETLRSSEQPSNATDTEQEREIWTQMCLEQSDARGAHSIHVNTYARWFWAHLFLSLCHSVCGRSIFWEPDDFVPSLSLRRLTLKGCVRKQKSPYLPRLLQIIAVEPGPTKSPRYSGGSFAKSGTPLHWSDVLPDGGQVVSLSEKEIVRKTLKRKCRTMKVRRLEYQQLHFDRRCQDAAKRHGAKRICRQHVINQVSTVKCIHRQHAIHWWPFRQVYSLEGQRPLEVISPSTGRKLVSRLQVIHVSWLGRSSPGSSAIPGGGEIVGLALSSSGFAATNNRANLLGQNPSGSTASHSNKKRRRDAAVDKGTNLYISEQDLRQHFGLTREEAARRLGVSVTTFKRHCRKHGILRWPCYRNRSSDIPGRPPDPDVVPPDFFDDLGACLETPISSFLEEIAASGSYEAAFLPQEQITVSFAYPTHNHPVSAQPHIASKEMASENTRSSDLTTQVEAHSEGNGSRSNYSSVPTFSNPALSQPVSTISETGPTVPQHISTIPGIGPSQLEARLEARGSGSSYLTVPTSSNPGSTQPMSTIPETGPAIPQPVSTIPVSGPTIPHIMPPLIAQQDMRLVTIKAKYSDSIVRFKLPLTSGLTELNENVAKRLNLRLDSFDVEYRDEEGLWILISCDEDLRDYMQLFCSLDTPVIKLSVLDKVVNANERSGSFKRKRPWDA